jgi:nickel transport protein
MKALKPLVAAPARILAFSAAALALALYLSLPAKAHGVVWDYSAKQSLGLQFSYDDGTRMKYAEVNVFGPDDDAKLTQVGRTDQNGYFAFVPTDPGKWVVTSNDGEGHLARAELSVAAEASGDAPAAPQVNVEAITQAAAKPYKIAMIVSLFLNVALASAIFKKGKASPAKGPA